MLSLKTITDVSSFGYLNLKNRFKYISQTINTLPKGYIMGGRIEPSTTVNTIDDFNFFTKISHLISATLALPKRFGAAVHISVQNLREDLLI